MLANTPDNCVCVCVWCVCVPERTMRSETVGNYHHYHQQTSYNKERFYIFSRREPSEEEDEDGYGESPVDALCDCALRLLRLRLPLIAAVIATCDCLNARWSE